MKHVQQGYNFNAAPVRTTDDDRCPRCYCTVAVFEDDAGMPTRCEHCWQQILEDKPAAHGLPYDEWTHQADDSDHVVRCNECWSQAVSEMEGA